MDLSPYIDRLRRDLARAADAGGDDARELADRLTAPLEPALRMLLLDALSAAADEITSDLAPGSVEVRLRGGNPEFVVTPPAAEPAEEPFDTPMAPPIEPLEDGGDGALARINLRLPERLKSGVEHAAGRERLSVNAWLVRQLERALTPHPRHGASRRSSGPGQGFTGWVQ
ncbi:MAG: hypothetical protein JWM86_1403 [Thermoleophilia bacterium]|nr:hypothetical protein [Thermoleophilia bacterium]